MLAHARDALPNECCGLLVGTETHIRRAERARNLKASPTRYEIDPADHFRSIRAARAEGLAVIGAYHSHPRTAPEPSPTDLVEASDSALLWVIVSPATRGALGEQVAAFRLVEDRFVRVSLVVGDSGRPRNAESMGGEPRPTA
jgi:proteasome lid subunit RPN8/RPN11